MNSDFHLAHAHPNESLTEAPVYLDEGELRALFERLRPILAGLDVAVPDEALHGWLARAARGESGVSIFSVVQLQGWTIRVLEQR